MKTSSYKILFKSTNQFKSSTQLRSVNVRHFEMVRATGLNSMKSKLFQYNHLHTKIHPNQSISSKVAFTSEV
jgi:hypothetical protein